MDGIDRGAAEQDHADAVRTMPTPDNSGSQDSSYSRPNSLDDPRTDSIQLHTPKSKDPSQLPPLNSSHPSSSHSSLAHLSQQPMSPPPSNQQHKRLPPLPQIPPLSPPHYGPPPSANRDHSSWSQMRSPTSAPSNPFYSSNTYRSSTPPLASSAEDSPVISPAKRFSSGEVKPPFSPNSPRTPLNDEDRAKFAQLATQLKTRLTYAAIKVENGWEKHSLTQIQNLLNNTSSEDKPSSRRRSQTIQELAPPFPEGQLTYESFWANHSRRQSSSHPSYISPPHHAPSQGSQPASLPGNHATFPRRKPDRLSITAARSHTARDQSAAEIMIALASPRTRSEFSSPERNVGKGEETDEEESPTRKVKKRDVEGLGIHA